MTDNYPTTLQGGSPMDKAEELRERIAEKTCPNMECDCNHIEGFRGLCLVRADGALEAIGLSETTLAWCAAHPETLAALAGGELMGPFQSRVAPWMVECFGAAISADIVERNHRFIEEALELVQSSGCTQSEAHQLVDYVFARPKGEPEQEVGGVMVTLAALCLATGLDMHEAGEKELRRVWAKIDTIRAKQAAKPKHSPLPAKTQEIDRDFGRDDTPPRGRFQDQAVIDSCGCVYCDLGLSRARGSVREPWVHSNDRQCLLPSGEGQEDR